jgi:2-methylcitrate dehydratase PrpD
MTSAQFSLHTTLAMRLVLGGNDLKHYEVLEEHNFRVREVDALADRVRIVVGDEEDTSFATRPFATVSVVLKDGTTVTEAAVSPGSPSEPFGWDATGLKAYRYATGIWSETQVAQLISRVRSWLVASHPVRELLPVSAAADL